MPASTGASPVRWRSGRVIAVEGPQVCVQLLALPECRYWFHSTNDANAMRLAMPDGPSSPSAGSTAGLVLPTAGAVGPAQSAPAMTSTPPAPRPPPRVHGVYSIDDVVVVYNRKLRAWEEATVINVSGSEILVRPFFQTTRSRDRWLDVNLRASDIEHLGDIVDSADQADVARRQAEQEARFAETLALRNPPEVVREVGGDGNCLYRAFAYQLFGTEDLHAEVREECFAYMIANREYFQQFVDGDFDAYIRTHSPNREHGDHIEVVAMAERFNKRVRMDTVEAAGNWADGSVYAAEPALQSLGCVRLMYVGRNHYRCVVCRDPRLDGPLGDGSGDAVRLSRFRAEQDQLHAPVVSAALAAAAAPVALAERQPRSPLSAPRPAAAHGDTVDSAEPVASRPLFPKNGWRLTASEKLAIWYAANSIPPHSTFAVLSMHVFICHCNRGIICSPLIRNGSSKEVGAVPAATVEIMFQQAVGHWTRRVQAMYGPVPSHVLISLQMELGEYFSDWRRRAASGRLWRNFAVYAMLDEAQDSVVEAFIVEILRK
jgi:hypothetical protein